MKRILSILLLLAVASPALADDILPALNKIKAEWEWCVETAHSLSGTPAVGEFGKRSERAFADCHAEEEFLLATIDLAFSESGRRQARMLHFKNKVAFKDRLTSAEFKAMAKQLGQKP